MLWQLIDRGHGPTMSPAAATVGCASDASMKVNLALAGSRAVGGGCERDSAGCAILRSGTLTTASCSGVRRGEPLVVVRPDVKAR
jgi:hypothetical protein